MLARHIDDLSPYGSPAQFALGPAGSRPNSPDGLSSSFPHFGFEKSGFCLEVSFMKSNIFGKALAVLILIGAVANPRLLLCQESRGTITGTVTDSARAVIQGASVKVTNVA